jgi:hypothetical protein
MRNIPFRLSLPLLRLGSAARFGGVDFTADGQALADIRTTIQRGGKKGIKHSVLLKASKLKTRDLASIVDTLVESDEVVVHEGEKARNGKPTRIYFWAG